MPRLILSYKAKTLPVNDELSTLQVTIQRLICYKFVSLRSRIIIMKLL